MRTITTLIILFFFKSVCATQAISVFVSFSMPEKLLEDTLKDCARLNIPAYLNGLHHNSMSEMAEKVMALSEHVPGLNLQIDPTAFERFGINQVPALVVSKGANFDVIYGNLSLDEGLQRIIDQGETAFSLQEKESLHD